MINITFNRSKGILGPLLFHPIDSYKKYCEFISNPYIQTSVLEPHIGLIFWTNPNLFLTPTLAKVSFYDENWVKFENRMSNLSLILILYIENTACYSVLLNLLFRGLYIRKQIRNFYQYENKICQKNKNIIITGYCIVCNTKKVFKIKRKSNNLDKLPNWRESLICPTCKLNNRQRASFHFLKLIEEKSVGKKFYITEQKSKLYLRLKKDYPNIIGSEFFSEDVEGSVNTAGIRNEDICNLSFNDGMFDVIMTYDTLEHIPHYTKAINECRRCLNKKGLFIFTVPFLLDNYATTVRAKINNKGNVHHTLPPEYHGDPMKKNGCLCFYHFGWELLDEVRKIGFKDVSAFLYWSKEYAYLGGFQIILLGKPPPLVEDSKSLTVPGVGNKQPSLS